MQSLNHFEVKPRGVGELLDLTFRQYKDFFSFWFLTSVFVLLPFLILNAVFSYGATTHTNDYLNLLTHSNNQAFSGQQLIQQSGVALGTLTLLGLLDIFIVKPLLFGAIVHFVSENNLSSNRLSPGQALRFAAKRLGAVIVTNLFRYLLLIVGFAIIGGLVGLVFGLLAAFKAASWLLILLGVLAGLGLICLGVWIAIKLSFVTPVAVEERKVFWSPIARSWVLTRRNFWRTLGYFIVLVLIVSALQSGISALAGILLHGFPLLSTVLSAVLVFFVTPLSLFGAANLYIDLRIRTDGLDLKHWLTSESEQNPVS